MEGQAVNQIALRSHTFGQGLILGARDDGAGLLIVFKGRIALCTIPTNLTS